MDENKDFPLDVKLSHQAFTLPLSEIPVDNLSNLPKDRLFKPPKLLPLKRQSSTLEISGDTNVETIMQSHDLVRQMALKQHRDKKEVIADAKQTNMIDIVDMDDESFEDVVSSEFAGKLSDSTPFRLFMTLIIVINSILIGCETSPSFYDANLANLKMIDSIILMAFVVEILLKWYCGFAKFWKSGWNIFDFVLIASAILAPSITFISSGRVLRVLRILRVFRVLRGAEVFEGLRLVAKTIIISIPDMLNIGLLLLILMFVFAIVGVTVFKPYSPDYFGDLSKAMFALWIMFTSDGFQEIFDPLQISGHFEVAVVYFVTFITLGSFVFGNMMVAVAVSNLESAYDKHNKAKKARYRKLNRTTEMISGQSLQRNVVPFDKQIKDKLMKQVPFEAPSLSSLSRKKIEDYCLTVGLMEENLKEYADIKSNLQQILSVVLVANKVEKSEQAEKEEDEEEGEDALADEEANLAGDPLSRLLSARKKA